MQTCTRSRAEPGGRPDWEGAFVITQWGSSSQIGSLCPRANPSQEKMHLAIPPKGGSKQTRDNIRKLEMRTRKEIFPPTKSLIMYADFGNIIDYFVDFKKLKLALSVAYCLSSPLWGSLQVHVLEDRRVWLPAGYRESRRQEAGGHPLCQHPDKRLSSLLRTPVYRMRINGGVVWESESGNQCISVKMGKTHLVFIRMAVIRKEGRERERKEERK